MSQRTKQIILLIALAQVLLAIGVFALPHAVRALPGWYYIRLQNHPLTADIMALVTTPLPSTLPTPVQATVQAAALPAIPGLPDATPTATATLAPPTATRPSTPTATTATPTATPTVTPSPTPLPVHTMLEGMGTIKQGFNNCGPANLTLVLNFHGLEQTQQEVASYLKPNREDRNVSPWQIENYVNDFTALRATSHSGGNLQMIKQFIAAGIPVVVEKGYKPNETEGWYGHYLTVYGYDDAKEEIYTRDTDAGPFDGRPRVDNYEDLLYWWQQFNYTFFVVYEPSQEELVFSIIPDYLEERETMWQYTAQLANEEIKADPDNVFGWFNLGVSLTRLGEMSGDQEYYTNGARAFDQAREIGLPPRTLYYEHRPFMAYWKSGRIEDVIDLTATMLDTTGGPHVEEIHWYRGHALAAQGNLIAAREAYQNALQANPNFSQAQLSLDWVNSELSG